MSKNNFPMVDTCGNSGHSFSTFQRSWFLLGGGVHVILVELTTPAPTLDSLRLSMRVVPLVTVQRWAPEWSPLSQSKSQYSCWGGWDNGILPSERGPEARGPPAWIAATLTETRWKMKLGQGNSRENSTRALMPPWTTGANWAWSVWTFCFDETINSLYCLSQFGFSFPFRTETILKTEQDLRPLPL